jgi:hypothetical protein
MTAFERNVPRFSPALGSLLCLFGFTFCLTILYLSMRGILDLGGYVASGGPYAITHPAPGWVWVLPVSIFVGAIFAVGGGVLAKRVGGLNPLLLAWPALFISLGWNFLEYGFHPPSGQGLVWGWIICGVIFVPMGLIPLIFGLRIHFRGRSERRRRMETSGEPGAAPSAGRLVFPILQLAVLSAGILCGKMFFESQARPSAGPASRQPAVSTARPPAAAAEISADGLSITLRNGSETLRVIGAGRTLIFSGRTYRDAAELPAGAARLYQEALRLMQDLWIGDRPLPEP